jgi:putative membrane protein (TIGR04086 family)
MRKNDERKSSGHNLLYSILLGAAIGFLLIFILFAVFSAFVASGKAPESLMPYLTALTGLLGAILAAVVAVRLHRSRVMLVGLGAGALMFVLTFVFSLFSGGSLSQRSMTLVLLVAFLMGGIVGSFLSLKRKRRKHA